MIPLFSRLSHARSRNLTLRKIAISLSKNCQKLDIFFKKNVWQFFDSQMAIFRRVRLKAYLTILNNQCARHYHSLLVLYVFTFWYATGDDCAINTIKSLTNWLQVSYVFTFLDTKDLFC